MTFYTRRSCLLAGALVAPGAPVLAACGRRTPAPLAQPTGEPAQSPGSTPGAVSSQPGSPAGVRLDSTLGESLVHLDVGPAVRVGQQTVVRLEASVDTDGGTATPGFGSSSLTDVYLLSLEQSLAWPVQDTSSKAAQGDTGGAGRAGGRPGPGGI